MRNITSKTISTVTIAILTLSMFLAAVPITVLPAAAETQVATATVDKITLTAGKTYGGAAGAEGLIFTVTNPSTNNVPIDQVNIVVPSDWTTPSTSNVALDPPIGSVSISGTRVIVVTLSSPYLQPGASFKIKYGTSSSGITVPSKVATGSPDVYTFEVYTRASGATTLVPVATHPSVYVTTATSISIEDPIQAVAVSADDLKYTVKVSLNVPEEGVPIQVALNPSSQRGTSSYGGNLSASIIWTDANGKASVTLNLDTKVASAGGTKVTIGGVDYYTWAKVDAKAWVSATDSPTAATTATTAAIATKAGKLSKLTVTTPTTTTYVPNGGTQTVTVSTTDQFDNVVQVTTAVTVYFTLGDIQGGNVGSLSATSATISVGGSSATVTYSLSTYGTVGSSCRVYASAAGLAGAVSPKLVTEVASTTAGIDWAVSLPASVKAGSSLTAQAKLIPTSVQAQAGVRVNFTITWPDGTTTVQSAVTNSSGMVSTTITAPTKSGTTVSVAAKAYKADGTQLGTTISASVNIIAGDPANLLVKTYEDIALTTEKSAVKPGGTLYVDVWLTDAYGNLATAPGTSLQVNLAASAGSLSATTVYVTAGKSKISDSGYIVVFTAPTITQSVTLTASTTQPGIAKSSVAVSVASVEPIVVITDPAADLVIASDTAVTKFIAGYAMVSPSAPTGTTIPGTGIVYSLDRAANVTVGITKVEGAKYYFNFSVTLTPNATHTIVVYATDTQGKVGASPVRVITVRPVVGPAYSAETKTPATLDAQGSPKTSFRLGETVIVSAKVSNVDVVSRSFLIAVQLKDPDGTVLPTQYVIVTLASGQSITPALSSIIPTAGYRAGTWTAKIMVLTTWPAQGGVSVAEPVEITFTVTG